MGRDLLHVKSFAETILECDALHQQFGSFSIFKELNKNSSDSLLNRSSIAHPCNIALQIALAQWLSTKGVQPSAFIGHSGGEVAAAYLAGAITLEETWRIVACHCQVIEQVESGGAMVHVALAAPDVEKRIKPYGEAVRIAALNGLKATVLSGDETILEELLAKLTAQNVFAKRLRIDIPFHTPVVAPYLEVFDDLLPDLKPFTPNVPVFSTLHGEQNQAGDFDADYWKRHILKPVAFVPAVQTAIREGFSAFLEIGAHPSLLVYLEEMLNAMEKPRFFTAETLRRNKEGEIALAVAAARLEAADLWPGLKEADDEKVLKQAARLFLEQQIRTNQQHSADIRSTVRSTVESVLQKPIQEDEGFFAMGLNSLGAVRIVEQLKHALGVALPPTLLFDQPDFISLCRHLEDLLRGQTQSDKQVHKPKSFDPSIAPIAIAGMACRFPGGANDLGAFWELLRQGRDAVTEIPHDRWDAEAWFDPDPATPGKSYSRWGGFLQGVDIRGFDASFFGLSPNEVKALDPQQRLLLELSWEAFEDAGHDPKSLRGRNVGVFVALSTDDYSRAHLHACNPSVIDPYALTGSAYSVACGRISYFFGLTGPSICIDTACSSSLVALHQAANALRQGECELALVVSANTLVTPELFVYFSKVHALSPTGRCRTFSDEADGYVRAEGAAALVLSPYDDSNDSQPIWGLLRGSAINQDGRSSGLTAPNGPAQERVIQTALQNAGLQPKDIDYLEAHGTGTKLGDPIEMGAIGSVFGQKKAAPLIVGSVKTNLGHLEACAGLAGVIKTLLAMHHRFIPPHLHHEIPSSQIGWSELPVVIPKQGMRWDIDQGGIRRAGVSAFGFGGTNAHVLLEESPRKSASISTVAQPYHLLAFSAHDSTALRARTAQLTALLRENKDRAELSALCTSTRSGSGLKQRVFVVAKDTDEAIEKLKKHMRVESDNQPATEKPRIAFLFSGQGSQRIEMGRELFETEPLFRQTIEQCDAWLKEHERFSLLELLYSQDASEEKLADTRHAQPAIYSIQVALVRLWAFWGVRPEAVLGHSIGEYAAAYATGLLELEEGLRLVSARGRIMGEQSVSGGMAAVFCDEAQLRPFLEAHSSLVIAGYNAPENLVVSGAKEALSILLSDLQKAGINHKELKVSAAFHSSLMHNAAISFQKEFENVQWGEARTTFFSTASGVLANTESLQNSTYWTDQILSPVRFSQALDSMLKSGLSCLIEIGAGSTLSSLARQAPRFANEISTSSLSSREGDWRHILQTLGVLFEAGFNPNWKEIDKFSLHQKKLIPPYPFTRQPYWMPLPHEQNQKATISTASGLNGLESWMRTLQEYEACLAKTGESGTQKIILEQIKIMQEQIAMLQNRNDS